MPNPPGGDLLEQLGVPLELVTDEATARERIASLPPTVGFDIETEPLPEHAPPPAWLAITKAGRLALRQPTLQDKTGLDPHRARPRLAQIYDPHAGLVYVVDLRAVPLEALEGLWSRRLVIHNAAFEIAMLHGLPRDTIDTMQLAGLVYGTARGARRLANVAEKALGIAVPKDLQTSDWSAARLSERAAPLRRPRRRARAPRGRDAVAGPGARRPPGVRRAEQRGPGHRPDAPGGSAVRRRDPSRDDRRMGGRAGRGPGGVRRRGRRGRAAAGPAAVRLAAAPPPGPRGRRRAPVVAAHRDRRPQHERRPPEAAGLVRLGAPADRGRQGRPAAQQLRPQAHRGDQPRDRPPARRPDAVRPEVGPHVLLEPEPAGPPARGPARRGRASRAGCWWSPTSRRSSSASRPRPERRPHHAPGLRGGPRPPRADRERDDRHRRGRRDEGAAQGRQAGELRQPVSARGPGACGRRPGPTTTSTSRSPRPRPPGRRCAPATPCCCTGSGG